MGKVVKLKQSNLDEEIKALLELNDQGKITDLFITYATPIEDDPDLGARYIHNYWFGETSCLFVLGMIDRMKTVVNNFIDEKWS
jgi:hypothetical protein